MGGRGSAGTVNVSPLEAFRENARQFNAALAEGKAKKAAVVEYKTIDGTTARRYWNGATYTDRASSLYEKEHRGTLKKRFKKPKSW